VAEDVGMLLQLRRDIQWIRLPAGSVYVGNACRGLVIQDAEVAQEIAQEISQEVAQLLDPASPHVSPAISPRAALVLQRMTDLGFLTNRRVESQHSIKKISDEDLLRRAAPELDLMLLRDGSGSAGVDRIRARADFPIVIFGSNRLAYALLALLQATGFTQTSLINRQRALRGTKARHPSQSRVSSLLATGLPVRRELVGNLHGEVAATVIQGSELNPPLHHSNQDANRDSGTTPALIIVTQFAAPENTQRWMTEGTAHLAISDWEDSTITVGPLVLPGTTPCSNCVDIARATNNPYLPKVRMMQSLSEPVEIPAALAAIVSGAVVLGVLEFYEQKNSSWIGATTEFDALDPCNPRHSHWQFNSSCGCLEVI
jgi:hypothetical protein